MLRHGYIRRGSALLVSMVTGLIVIAFATASVYLTSQEQSATFREHRKMISRYVAESAQTRTRQLLRTIFLNSQLSFAELDKMDGMAFFTDELFLASHNNTTYLLGKYSVSVKILKPTDIVTTEDITGDEPTSVRYIAITATSSIVNPGKNDVKTKVRGTYKIITEVPKVFDYCYFINNWGWFHGNDITTFGNARSNGSFSMGTYRPTIWGKPRFESSDGIDLIGYIDDNLDGQLNGQDGGIYAWNTIDGMPSTNGRPSDLYAGLQGTSTQYSMDQIPMPNLNDLSMYERIVKEAQSNITIGGQVVCDGIVGDNESAQNLYLEGTYENPITLNGPIVVRGDVILRGYVQGQGVIYSGRNVYLPQRLLYKNPPGERRPSNNSESARENWRSTNMTTDMLGLFSRENIVLGDYTNSTWQSYVQSWLNNPANVSKEDSGTDKIPNTDDNGEDDNIWTVLKNNQGAVYPGTGEDIDGDGKFDATTSLSDFNLSTNVFYTGHTGWIGNIPAGVTSFRQLSFWDETADSPGVSTLGSQKFPQVDAILYTNHFLGGYIQNTNGYNYKNDNRTHFLNESSIYFNGAVISRNESLIYDARELIFQHDERLSGSDGSVFHMVLPRVWKPLKTISIEIDGA